MRTCVASWHVVAAALVVGVEREGGVGGSMAKGVGRNEMRKTLLKLTSLRVWSLVFFLVFFWCVTFVIYLLVALFISCSFCSFFFPWRGEKGETPTPPPRRAAVRGYWPDTFGGGGGHLRGVCTRTFVGFFPLPLVLSRPWRDRGGHVTTKPKDVGAFITIKLPNIKSRYIYIQRASP